MEAKAQAAKRVLKQLGVAIKTSALFPASYPGTGQALAALLNALRTYMEAYGPFSVHVGVQTLSVGGIAIQDRTFTNLAYSFYSRKVSQLTVQPTVSQLQLAALVSIVGMERNKLEEAGGVVRLLWESGAGDIQVREMAMRLDEEVDILGVNAFFSLLGRGRLSPQEREQVIEILTAGPPQIGKFLQNFYALAGKVQDGITEEGQVQQVYQAIKSLDRLILDEPFDQHRPLYANLAAATLQLEEPLGSRLARALLSGAGEDAAAQVILDQLSGEQLAKTILMSLGEGNVGEQVAAVMGGLTLDREKATGVLGILESQLPRQGKGGGLLPDAASLELRSPSSRAAYAAPAADEAPPVIEFDEGQIVLSDEELERYLKEFHTIDEAGATREAIKTLVDVLSNEVEEWELVDVAETLAAHIPWLLEHREFALLREILKDIKTISSTAGGARAEVITGLLERLTESPLLDGLLAALWEGRETPAEQQIQACMEVLAEEMVGPLVRVLGVETRAGMRAMLCDALVRIGPGHMDELGAFVTDPRWYLVRNIGYILGRMRTPQGVTYLAKLVQHSDARVRTQTVEALASIGTEDAQALIGAFLNDPEQSVRLRALRSLDARGMYVAMPKLLALLETRDPFNRLFVLKQAGIDAVARLGAREALPALKKLARARLVLSRRGRELRRLARMAIGIIESAPTDAQAIVPVMEGGGKAP